MIRKILTLLLLAALGGSAARAQLVTVAGQVLDDESRQPIEFATIYMKENGHWAVTDAQGQFRIKDIPTGKTTVTVQCLGYATRQLTLTISSDMPRLRIVLRQESLKLDEVTVTARRKSDEATTSYTIDRTALDNQQILNVGDISTLLPGGKTVNPSLINDQRMALRSESQEKGNASFGTAIEVDGMRLGNNAAPGETAGASTRTVSTSNIESIEVVTGIPSVEYGDLSNGIVKVNTRKGKSPFIVEGRLTQHTRQIALNKGFDLGRGRGVLNASFEHARSFSNAASPHTAYQRNILSMHYMNVFMKQTTPLTLNIGLTANVGGYNSESDPDNELDDYAKVRDNALRAHLDLNWLLNKPFITNLSLRAAISTADRRTTNYTHQSSASTQPCLHVTEQGYHIAQTYDDLSAPNSIILSPTGYWHTLQYHDSKPLDWSLRLKGDWSRRFGRVLSRLMVGAEYTGSRNNGRGTWYDDLRYAPTWREYRYDDLPTLHNVAIYAEEKVSIPTSKRSTFEMTAGLRGDITHISSSDYGTVGSMSPRLNSRYIFWQHRRRQLVSDLSVHAGWGKSVKLPSFQVLYPAPAYRDMLAFSSPSTADNTSFYAYYTHPSRAVYNPDLRWQYTLQTDLGIEMTVAGTRIALSAFHHRTRNPYMATSVYTPFAYQYTAPAALNTVTIPVSDRRYAIDPTTGQVTVSAAVPDASPSGPASPLALPSTTRRTYLTNTRYTNASPIDRYGVEWTVDFPQIKPLRTAIRLDGNYYYYKGLDEQLFADIPLSSATMTDGQPYQYVGWYRGSNATSTGYTASASVANGALSRQLNLNATVTTHIPKIRLIVALRIESTLYSYSRPLSELSTGTRAFALADKADYPPATTGNNGATASTTLEDHYVALYPEYYSTWDNPTERLPFAERFLWAKDNDPVLFSDLSKLVVRSNYAYTMNPNRLSAYYSANLTVTKEIGNHVSLSFYANNFLNNMSTVRSSQTGMETSLFASGYIPSFYYGLSLKLKL